MARRSDACAEREDLKPLIGEFEVSIAGYILLFLAYQGIVDLMEIACSALVALRSVLVGCCVSRI